jgi:hypothetical protein
MPYTDYFSDDATYADDFWSRYRMSKDFFQFNSSLRERLRYVLPAE